MESCDRRTHTYKNGKTFDQCKEIAESMNPDFKKQIEQKRKNPLDRNFRTSRL